VNYSRLYLVGFLLLFVGLFIFAVSSGSPSSSFGAVVFIGPFPIVFGTGPDSGSLILIGVLIAVAMLAVFLLSVLAGRRMVRREDGSYT
jgi:uncharacterized membrane protein